MNIEYIKQNYYFETLSENHDLSDFDCGDENLNDFLKNDALKLQNSKLNITILIICHSKIIGYTSLLTDAIIIRNIRDEKIKNIDFISQRDPTKIFYLYFDLKEYS